MLGPYLSAFVLVKVQPVGSSQDIDLMLKVKKEISDLPGVTDIKGVFGLYDFVVTVEVKTPEELGVLVTQTIRNIKGVLSTETMVIGF